MAATLLAALVAGGLIGPLVHAALPGHDGLSGRAAAVLGAVSAAVGTWIYMAASGSHAPGVDGTSLLIGAVVAAALIAGHRVVSRDHGNDWVRTSGNNHGSRRPSGYER
jgi:uncharacterized membrane protein YeaQ/YmgE (transglycosylase-associated protein family)